MIEIEITRVSELPDDIGILAAAAYAEGYRNIRTLVREFIAGENRFQGSGECLFTAHESGELVGIGGLNIDPYQSSETVARVRRLYVLPSARRKGVASKLMEAIERHAALHFRRIQLYTASADAARFYARLGYREVSQMHKVSHEKQLVERATSNKGNQ